jgi:uncharacterized protein
MKKNNEELAARARDISSWNGLTKILMLGNNCDDFILERSITTKVVKTKKDDENAQKFNQLDWSEPLSKTPSHRLLATCFVLKMKDLLK